jgi:DNA-binding MurR/RpiR family transcriptional regulator
MFRENIRKHYDHLSKSYRKVADFILSDYRTAAFMTAAALADAVAVDTTTVVRFAQRLGYPGFPELIDDIQDQVKIELSQSYAAPADEDTVQAEVQRFMVQNHVNLERALAHNTLESLEQVIDMLRAAPRIIVAGESFAGPIASSFAEMLRDSGRPAIYSAGDVYTRARDVAHLLRKEVVIGVTPVEGPSGIARLLRYAREEGAISVACTPSLSSHAARSAEYLIYAPGETDRSLPSLLSLYAILTSIAQALAAEVADATAKRTLEIDQALKALT